MMPIVIICGLIMLTRIIITSLSISCKAILEFVIGLFIFSFIFVYYILT